MQTLFRPEALAAQQQGWLGSIQLIRPLSLSLLTAAALGAALLVAVYLGLGGYTRKAHVTGVLLPDLGMIRLLPPEQAVVLERHAREGQRVKQGELLFVLSVDRSTGSGDAQAAVLRNLGSKERSLRDAVSRQAELAASQRAALERQLNDRRGELAQLDAEAQLHRQRLALSRAAQARFDALRADNFVSSAQVQTKAEEVLAVQAQLQGLERQRATQQREIGALEAQLHELPLRTQTATGELERDLAGVAQAVAETEARQRVVVRAPSDGVLSAVLADPGQSVTPSAALATLVPSAAQLQANLYAPSSSIGFLRPGLPVLLRYQAFPYQKFGHQTGTVLQVGRTPLSSAELANVPLAGLAAYSTVSGEPLYRITVTLDRQGIATPGGPQMLAAGMQLDADVELERRRLIEWMVEPLLGLRGRMAPDTPAQLRPAGGTAGSA